MTTLYLNYPIIERDYQIFRALGSLQIIENDIQWKLFLSNLNQNQVIHSLPAGGNFTGDPLIDDQLNEVLRLAFRDYINSWYAFLSPSQQFTSELYAIAQTIIKSMAQRFSLLHYHQNSL